MSGFEGQWAISHSPNPAETRRQKSSFWGKTTCSKICLKSSPSIKLSRWLGKKNAPSSGWITRQKPMSLGRSPRPCSVEQNTETQAFKTVRQYYSLQPLIKHMAKSQGFQSAGRGKVTFSRLQVKSSPNVTCCNLFGKVTYFKLWLTADLQSTWWRSTTMQHVSLQTCKYRIRLPFHWRCLALANCKIWESTSVEPPWRRTSFAA